MRRALVTVGLLALSPAASAADFTYNDPGTLIAGSGQGAVEFTVFAPGMRYPMEEGPSYPNSQVWGHGGGSGPGGSQCDVENYSYPWWDNYCETRSWDMPLCPAGVGHQGQDIRPATCDDLTHWNVASEAGTVTNIGSYSVYVTAADGTRFDYLHGGGNIISSGQALAKGERINLVSNAFGGTPTTIHLHFNIRQDVAGVGIVFVSPYMSLVESYQELLGITGGEGTGAVESNDCQTITGWAQDADNPDASIPVRVDFGEVQVDINADIDRQDLCEALGSCAHGFEIEVPRSLRDGQVHDVQVFAVLGETELAEVEASPTQIQCDAAAVPDGVRRVVTPEVLATWGLSPFWDGTSVDDVQLAAIPHGGALPGEIVLVRADAGDTESVWLMDPGYKRRVDPNAAAAWGLDISAAQVWPAHVLDEAVEGTPLRPAPFLIQSLSGEVWVMDDEQCAPDCEGTGDGSGDVGGTEGGERGEGGGGPGTETDGPGFADGEDSGSGCGCQNRPESPMLAFLPGIALLTLRRRRTA